MTTKIQLTPSELQAQAKEMQLLQEEYDSFFSGVSTELKSINGNWSPNLSHNFEGKINSAQKSFAVITQELAKGALVANSCAETFESVDSLLAKISQAHTQAMQNFTRLLKNLDKVDVGDYCEKVTDAEYARLCKLAYDALKKDDPEKAFIDLLHNDSYLPENDPLKNVTSSQVSVEESISGFSAITIEDGDNVIVIFAGTNGDIGDIVADAQLTLGEGSVQSAQAIAMVNKLSKKYSNIVVTGHSLGGYLATSATLKNSSVSKCVAFDPPGRWDTAAQSLFNGDRTSKVTTYEAKGSLISKVGFGVGDVKDISVKENGNAVSHNHGIKQICDALGGKKTIKNSWD